MDIKEMKIDISNENVCNYCLIHLKCLHYLIVYRSNIRNMLIVYGFKDPKTYLKKIPKKDLEIDFDNPSGLLPILAGSLLLLLIGFLLWLPSSQRFSAHLSASQSPIPELSVVFPSSQRFSEFPESPRAQKNRRDHWWRRQEVCCEAR